MKTYVVLIFTLLLSGCYMGALNQVNEDRKNNIYESVSVHSPDKSFVGIWEMKKFAGDYFMKFNSDGSGLWCSDISMGGGMNTGRYKIYKDGESVKFIGDDGTRGTLVSTNNDTLLFESYGYDSKYKKTSEVTGNCKSFMSM